MSWYEPDDGLSQQDEDRLCDRAREYAAEDPELEFPEDGNMDEIDIELDDAPVGRSGWWFKAIYKGRSVSVEVSDDFFYDYGDY
jgi:hypothetical protein